jgi:DNA-binding MarR family transcriptional regulator
MKSLCELKEVFKTIFVFDSLLQKEFSLSLNECLLVCALAKEKRSSGEMAHELGLSPSRISRILGKLEKKHLIGRAIAKDDKRKMIFALTSEGDKKVDQIHSSSLQVPEIKLMS